MAPKSQKPSRNHHFVPRSVLRRFSIGGDRQQVWVYDKQTGRRFSAGLGGAGSANDYNTFTTPDGEVLNFEEAFDTIDGAFATIGDALHDIRSVAGMPLDIKARLADGVAVQFLRTPIVRSTFQSIPRQLAEALVQMGFEPPAEDEFPTDNDARVHSLEFIAKRDELRKALLDKDLILFEPAGETRFWTSDHPVARRNDAPNGDLGFGARGVQIYMPISSDLMVGFLCPSILKQLTHIPLETMRLAPEKLGPMIAWRDGLLHGLPVRIDDDLVRIFNEDQAYHCRRFVYGDQDDFSLVDHLLEAHPTARANETLVTMGKVGEGFGPSNNVRDGQWLALYGRERTHIVPLVGWDPETHGSVAITDLPALLDDVLGDAPFTRAEFYVDRIPVRMIGGGVDIIVLERNGVVRFQVVHADPALRGWDERLK
jgi:hypothetical protein